MRFGPSQSELQSWFRLCSLFTRFTSSKFCHLIFTPREKKNILSVVTCSLVNWFNEIFKKFRGKPSLLFIKQHRVTMKLLLLLLVCQVGYICGSAIFYEYHQPLIPFYDHYSFYQPSRASYPKRAEVQLLSSDGSNVVGRLMLTDTGAGTSIVGDIWGLTPGYHGFHVHENGELGDMCKEAGGHFNPDEKEHGAPTDKERHAGDLGNIDAGHDGVARVRIFDPMIRLNGGKYDITNKAFVVHSDPDDLGRGGQDDSKTTGHAGARVACGIVRTIL